MNTLVKYFYQAIIHQMFFSLLQWCAQRHS